MGASGAGEEESKCGFLDRQDSSYLVCSHEFGLPLRWVDKAFNAQTEGPKSLKAPRDSREVRDSTV